MTPTHTTCGIMTAVLASAMLSACSSTSADEQQNSQSQPAHQAAAVSSEPTTTDIAEEDARPPFPELGPFDPNLRGEDMPDPCTWATTEIMAELGYTNYGGSETFEDFRSCDYSQETEDDANSFSVGIAFTGAPIATSLVDTPEIANGIEFYNATDTVFDFNSYASVISTAGAFEVAVTSFGQPSELRENEAERILWAILGETSDEA